MGIGASDLAFELLGIDLALWPLPWKPEAIASLPKSLPFRRGGHDPKIAGYSWYMQIPDDQKTRTNLSHTDPSGTQRAQFLSPSLLLHSQFSIHDPWAQGSLKSQGDTPTSKVEGGVKGPIAQPWMTMIVVWSLDPFISNFCMLSCTAQARKKRRQSDVKSLQMSSQSIPHNPRRRWPKAKISSNQKTREPESQLQKPRK